MFRTQAAEPDGHAGSGGGCREADFVVIAAPANIAPKNNLLDINHEELVIDAVLMVNPDAVMVILADT